MEDLIIARLHRQVELGQNVLALPHDADQLVGQVLRVTGHEADAGNAHCIQPTQEFREGHIAFKPLAVGVHVLTQQHDLLYAAVLQLLRLGQDGFHPAAAFTTADVRHNAVGAEVVTPIHNGDVGCIPAQALHRQVFGNGVHIFHFHHGAVCIQPAAEQFGQLVEVGGAKGQVDELILLQDLLGHAGLLDHAAAHGNDQIGVALAHFLQPGHIAKSAALGIVADAAGVEDHKIRVLAVRCFVHAHVPQHSRQDLAVVGVHLAAVGHHIVAPGALG